MKLICTAIAAACIATVALPAEAAVVYQQAPSATVSTAWTSQFGIGQGGYQTMDDFRVGHDARINHVSWRGTYFTVDAGGLHGAAPNTDTWTVEFWSGDASGPQQQLYSQDYAVGKVARTSLGNITLNTLTFDLYDFDLDLTQVFDILAGQTYWFSVMSKSTTFSPFFSWTSSDGPGNSWQRLFDGNGRVLGSNVRTGQRAFALSENTVPEPASLALVACALLAGGLASQRRKAA